MQLRNIIFITLLLNFWQYIAQTNFLKQGKKTLMLERDFSTYKVGDTLISFDSIMDMKLICVIKKDNNLWKNVDLLYKQDKLKQEVTVSGVFQKNNLFWEGKLVFKDFSSNKMFTEFYVRNDSDGIRTFYENDKVMYVSSNSGDNFTTIGVNTKNGKLLYYTMKDSTFNNDGHFLSFYENGAIEKILFYVENIPKGESSSYYENGVLKERGFYLGDQVEIEKVEDKIIYVNSKGIPILDVFPKLDISKIDLKTEMEIYLLKNGEWLYFDESGRLIKKEMYKEGNLVKVKTIKNRLK